MRLFFLSAIACYLLMACSCNNAAEELTVEKFYSIDVDKTENFVDLKLTDLADSIRFVALETTKQSLLSNPYFYVSDEFIIALSQGEYYKFSSNGKFIRKIINKGRGPQEISILTFPYFDEGKNLLYLNASQHKYSILVYDLASDNFQKSIPKGIPDFMSAFGLLDDSLIISSYYKPMKDGSMPDALIIQNLKGNILSKIPNYKKMLYGVNRIEGFQQSSLYNFSNDYYIEFSKDDTLFVFKNNMLIPYLALNFNHANSCPPDDNIKNGDHSFTIITMTHKSVLISISYVENVKYYSGGNASWDVRIEFLLLDKETGHYSRIKSYNDNITGLIKTKNSDEISFPRNLNNGRIVIPYNPIEIKEILTKGQQNKDLPSATLEQLQKISNNLTETDNPYLLIGKIKI